LAPASSNFIPSDSILWELLKERVYSNNPRILEYLKDNNERFVAGTDQQILRKVAGNTVKMANVCLREGMERFQKLLQLFKFVYHTYYHILDIFKKAKIRKCKWLRVLI